MNLNSIQLNLIHLNECNAKYFNVTALDAIFFHANKLNKKVTVHTHKTCLTKKFPALFEIFALFISECPFNCEVEMEFPKILRSKHEQIWRVYSFVEKESVKLNILNVDSQLKSESLNIYLDLISRNEMMHSEK